MVHTQYETHLVLPLSDTLSCVDFFQHLLAGAFLLETNRRRVAPSYCAFALGGWASHVRNTAALALTDGAVHPQHSDDPLDGL